MTQHSLTALQADAGAHLMHPFVDNAALKKKGPRIMSRAEGVYIWDEHDNRYLDAFAGLWCVNLGYGRQELVDAASRQMSKLPYYNLFFNTSNEPAIALAKTLSELTPQHINHAFFCGSGSEANDTVFRMVRRYWDLKKQPSKKIFIGRKNGYHGSTVAGASLGGMGYMHKQGDLPIAGIDHINQPYWFAEGGELSPEEFGRQRAAELEQKILDLGADNVAAFIAEPIQGAGGIIIPPDSYWPEIQRIVKQYNVLLVADEVICGFGRTGNWFGSTTLGIAPDIMSVAKGLSSGYLPIGGVLLADAIAETLTGDGSGEFNHGYTYSGHPVCAAVALENLRILREEHIVETIQETTGPHLAKQLESLSDHPLVGEVRGVGMLGALELVSEPGSRNRFDDKGTAGTICRDCALENGLILRATGDTMLLSPPLTISCEQIDEVVAKARVALDAADKKLRAHFQ